LVAPNVASTEVEKGVLNDPKIPDAAPCAPSKSSHSVGLQAIHTF
jgi:hypothetical protein